MEDRLERAAFTRSMLLGNIGSSESLDSCPVEAPRLASRELRLSVEGSDLYMGTVNTLTTH